MNAAPSKGLGKGLSALMGEDYSTVSASTETSSPNSEEASRKEGLHQLPIDRIHSGPFQPRVHFDESYLHELADSIEKNGIMQPIIVRPSSQTEGDYEIIAGERRWRASKLAKQATIPAIIRDIDNQLALELALVENIQRQDLTVLEEANGYQRLIEEFHYTQEELARTVGKSRSHIANLLRLLELPESIKRYLDSGELSMGHARALLTSDNKEKIAEQAVKQGLNVRQIENLVRSGDIHGAEKPPARPTAPSMSRGSSGSYHHGAKDPDILALEETLSDNLGLKVSINDHGGQKGDVIIHYEALTQLDDILRRLSDGV